MIRSLRQALENPDIKRVAGNALSLSGLQLANNLLPLVTIPYVVRVVGPSKFGLISFAQAFVGYFLLMVNYGFDLSASRKISIIRNNPDQLAQTFWSVFWTKILLFAGSTFLFGASIWIVPQLRDSAKVMAASYFLIAGYVLFPTWLFQGIEKLGMSAVFNLVVKLIFTLGVFVLLKTPGDFLIVPLMLSAGQFVAGSIALIYVLRTTIRKFVVPPLVDIQNSLREGWGVFLSTIFINFYTASNTVILGFFTTQQNVGYFAGGAKIVMAVQALLLYPLSQAVYPHSSRVISEDVSKGTSYLRRLIVIVVAIALPVSLVLFLAAPIVVRIVLGSQYAPATAVVQILAFFPLIIGLSNIFGIQGMLGMKLDKTFLKVIVLGSVIDLIMNIALDPRLQEVGSSLAWLVTEIFITVGLYVALHKAGMKLVTDATLKNWYDRSIGRIEI